MSLFCNRVHVEGIDPVVCGEPAEPTDIVSFGLRIETALCLACRREMRRTNQLVLCRLIHGRPAPKRPAPRTRERHPNRRAAADKKKQPRRKDDPERKRGRKKTPKAAKPTKPRRRR